MAESNSSASLLARLITTTLGVIFVDWILTGVHIDGVMTALFFAIVLALLNILVKPMLIVLTLPITVVTLGLFLVVINALMILLAAEIVPGIKVDGFWWAALFSIILSLIVSLLHGIQQAYTGRRQ